MRRILLLCLVFVIPLTNMAFAPISKDIPHHSGGAQAGVILFLHDFPLVALLALGFQDIFFDKTRVYFSIIDLIAWLVIGWSIITIYNSVNLPLSIAEIIRMIKLYLVARVIAGNTRTKQDLQFVLGALLAGFALESLIGALQYVGIDVMGLGNTAYGDDESGGVVRIVGTLGWPNTLGAYLAANIVIGLMIWLCNGLKGHWNTLLFLVSVFGVLPLVLTFSRGSWLSLILGLMASFTLAWLRGWITLNVVPKLALMASPGVVFALAFADSIMARFGENTIDVRFQLNDVAFTMIYDKPFLGVGINTFTEVLRAYDDTGVWYYFFEPVHNAFLLIASETGIIGLGLFMLLFLTAMWEAWAASSISDRFVSIFSISLVGALTAIAFSNIGDVHLRTETVYALFWVVIGLIMSMRRMQLAEAHAQQDARVGEPLTQY